MRSEADAPERDEHAAAAAGPTLGRRAFLARLTGGVPALAALPLGFLGAGPGHPRSSAGPQRTGAARAPSARLLYAGPAVSPGAAFGAAEADHVARLLGGAVRLDSLAAEDDAGAAAALERARVAAEEPVAVLTSLPAHGALADACAAAGLTLLDTRPVRPCGPCRPHVFHLGITEAEATATAQGAEGVVLWHPTLTRYGATQLNDRYARAQERPMDGATWADWLAVKLVWEGAARGARASTLAAWLRSEAARFDGHKGRPLRFRPADHQLDQPVYRVRAGAVEDEAGVAVAGGCG